MTYFRVKLKEWKVFHWESKHSSWYMTQKVMAADNGSSYVGGIWRTSCWFAGSWLFYTQKQKHMSLFLVV